MSYLTVPTMRSQISDEVDALKITIPSRKNWFEIPFISLWLCGWAFGEIAALTSFGLIFRGDTGDPSLFLLVWLTGWTIGGIAAMATLLWQLVGQEIVEVSGSGLRVRRQMLMLGRSVNFDGNALQNLRVAQGHQASIWSGRRRQMRQFWSFGDGRIAFDYGARTFHFASEIDEAEALQLLDIIQQRFPAYAGQATKGNLSF